MASKNLGNGTEPSTSPRAEKPSPKPQGCSCVTRLSLCPECPSLSLVQPGAPSLAHSCLAVPCLRDASSLFLLWELLPRRDGAAKPAPPPGGQRGASPRRDLPAAVPGPRPSFPPPPPSAILDPLFSPCAARQPGRLEQRPQPCFWQYRGFPVPTLPRQDPGPAPHLQARPRCPERAPSPQPPCLPEAAPGAEGRVREGEGTAQQGWAGQRSRFRVGGTTCRPQTPATSQPAAPR